MKLPSIPPWAEAIVRVIQFVSAIVSLVLWAIYLSKLASGQTSPMKAVLGIVVAGTVWTMSAVVTYAWKHRQGKKGAKAWGGAIALILLVVAIDFCFIILFAAVAGITGPSARGRGSACQVGDDDDDDDGRSSQNNPNACGENKAVFGLAIVNVFSFSFSSIINAIQSSQGPPNPKKLAQGGAAMDGIKNAVS